MIGGVQIDFVEDEPIKQKEVDVTLTNSKPFFKPFERVSFTSYSDNLYWNSVVKVQPKCALED